MQCTKCSNYNPEEAEFCGRCGINIDRPSNSEVKSDLPELPMVKLVDAIRLGFKNYRNYRGRSRRSEYWWFWLFIQIVAPIVTPIIRVEVVFLIVMFFLVPLTTRRLHDIGKSGWYQLGYYIVILTLLIKSPHLLLMLLNDPVGNVSASEPGVLIPFLGFLAFTIVWIIWLTQKGNEGPNKYGPDPKQPSLE